LNRTLSAIATTAVIAALSACSGESNLPNIATSSGAQTPYVIKSPGTGTPRTMDSTVLGDTVSTGGGGGAPVGDTTNDDVPGAGDPGGCRLLATRGASHSAIDCNGGGGGVAPVTVAVQPGPPEPGKICSGSPEAVDDSFYNQNRQNVEVQDMNSLWVDGSNAGWLYLGSDGNTYIQYNFANKASFSFGVSIGIVSVGSSTPGGYSSIYRYNGDTGATGSAPPGTQVEKCFQQGQSLGGNFA